MGLHGAPVDAEMGARVAAPGHQAGLRECGIQVERRFVSGRMQVLLKGRAEFLQHVV